ncbi:MAG: plasmid partitioning protein RepB [Gemmobacter sp.]|uniref:plasmid partitioning protein RepB n=1 Tax=Gemmobacter sp. TaxID=1898957 RepID=UPI001A5405E3|nr:plasmid partitioning protein RepB [Gemmobacter sp.]MBL8561195.1 plasmid partitioning protein RepB [Gemmobacter sp.]
MARKNLLEGLMGAAPAPSPAAPPPRAGAETVSAPPDPTRPRYAKGAIGAISRSVADLQARALIEIDPMQIEAGGLQDRLESDSAEDAALRDSIAEYGQQVPVLVRPHPEHEGRFQIVYGRRRVLALRELGRPVKALVRQLDDRDLIIAQGQENTARRDLSFIEKASFARQMLEAGYDRKIIGDTLSMDKTLISRMISVGERISPEIVQAIGAAPSIGRDRWLALADALTEGEHAPQDVVAMINLSGAAASDARFEAALAYASRRPAPPSPAKPAAPPAPLAAVRALDGKPLAQAARRGGRLVIRMEKNIEAGFEDWLLAQIPQLHQAWSKGE